MTSSKAVWLLSMLDRKIGEAHDAFQSGKALVAGLHLKGANIIMKKFVQAFRAGTIEPTQKLLKDLKVRAADMNVMIEEVEKQTPQALFRLRQEKRDEGEGKDE
jgi:hypothetical protein